MSKKKDNVKRVFSSLVDRQDLPGIKSLCDIYYSVVDGEMISQYTHALRCGHEHTPKLLFNLMFQHRNHKISLVDCLTLACAEKREDVVFHVLSRFEKDMPAVRRALVYDAKSRCIDSNLLDVLKMLCRWSESDQPLKELGYCSSDFTYQAPAASVEKNVDPSAAKTSSHMEEAFSSLRRQNDYMVRAVHSNNIAALEIILDHVKQSSVHILELIKKSVRNVSFNQVSSLAVAECFLNNSSAQQWIADNPFKTLCDFYLRDPSGVRYFSSLDHLLDPLIDYNEAFLQVFNQQKTKTKDYQSNILLAFHIIDKVDQKTLSLCAPRLHILSRDIAKGKEVRSLSINEMNLMSAKINQAHLTDELKDTQPSARLVRKM